MSLSVLCLPSRPVLLGRKLARYLVLRWPRRPVFAGVRRGNLAPTPSRVGLHCHLTPIHDTRSFSATLPDACLGQPCCRWILPVWFAAGCESRPVPAVAASRYAGCTAEAQGQGVDEEEGGRVNERTFLKGWKSVASGRGSKLHSNVEKPTGSATKV